MRLLTILLLMTLSIFGANFTNLQKVLETNLESSTYMKEGHLKTLHDGQILLQSAQGIFRVDLQNKKTTFLIGHGGRTLDDVVTAFNQTISLEHSYNDGDRNNLVKFETLSNRKVKVPIEIKNYQGNMRLVGDTNRLIIVANDFLYLYTSDTWQKVNLVLSDELIV